MLWSILWSVIVGALIGALARVILPGRQNISTLMTVVLGVLGALIGSWLTYQFGYKNANGGFEWIPGVVGVLVAAALIIGYGMLTGKDNTHQRLR